VTALYLRGHGVHRLRDVAGQLHIGLVIIFEIGSIKGCLDAGVTFRTGVRALHLVQDEAGRVTGVELAANGAPSTTAEPPATDPPLANAHFTAPVAASRAYMFSACGARERLARSPSARPASHPAARYTASANSVAAYAYADNYLIDLKHAVIMDVEATTAIRQAEVGAAKTMLDRTTEQFDVTPSRLVADGGYGSAEMVGWLVDERGIEPHVNLIDKAERTEGTFSRSDFAYDPEGNFYVCPGGKQLRKYHRAFSKPRDGLTKDGTMIFFARKHDCEACALKPKCCPNVPARKIARSVHEAARDRVRAIAKTEAYAVSCRERKKVEMLFAHLKRILRLGRLRLRGPNGAKDEFLLAATAQNLRKLAKLIPLRAPIFAT
jgi:hypothetical protein